MRRWCQSSEANMALASCWKTEYFGLLKTAWKPRNKPSHLIIMVQAPLKAFHCSYFFRSKPTALGTQNVLPLLPEPKCQKCCLLISTPRRRDQLLHLFVTVLTTLWETQPCSGFGSTTTKYCIMKKRKQTLQGRMTSEPKFPRVALSHIRRGTGKEQWINNRSKA